MSSRSMNELLPRRNEESSSNDLENGVAGIVSDEENNVIGIGREDPNEEEIADYFDSFDIADTKNVSLETLRRWRKAALVLNASRRFRYTLDLKNEEGKEKRKQQIRTHAHVIRAALLFKLSGERQIDGRELSLPVSRGDFGIKLEQLCTMNREHNLQALQDYGGVKGIARLLKTDLDNGIYEEEAELCERKNTFGANTYPPKKGRSFLSFLWDAWKDPTLIVLICAAILSLGFGIKVEGIKEGWYDGASIFFAVILVIIITAVSDYRQSLQFQNLNKEKRNIQLEVVRGGRRLKISIFDILVGDIIFLSIGDQVPADGIFVSGHSFSLDESSMTGESIWVHKTHKEPFLMSGCKVAEGVGTMMVTSVGLNTEWGLVMASTSENTGEETPLQVRLSGVATLIGAVGIFVAVSVFIILLSRYFSGNTTDFNGNKEFIGGQTPFSKAFDESIKIITIAITIIVVAVPEGLPLAVTLTLAYSMRKMMQDKALVRRLSACETMGSATTICSDKTGTLTLNQMMVVEAYVGKEKLRLPNDVSLTSAEIVSQLFESIAQNTSGSVFVPEDNGEPEVTGSPTEKALLWWGLKMGMKFDQARISSKILTVIPFNSQDKRGGVAVQTNDSQVRIHWKGAAELILSSCSYYVTSNNELHPIDPHRETIKTEIEDMAARSLRCIAFAYTPYSSTIPDTEEDLSDWKLPDNELTLLAIVGIKDPCRPEVRDAVLTCQRAGVKVRMVTGDNVQTATAIALDCGILTPDDDLHQPTIIQGGTFRALSEDEREQVAKDIIVMGRSSPMDKLLLVKALKKGGDVVAVTGDGTNDAPALKEADIGLSMGIQGTEVAKESSDIIILDDNFNSVVKVVRWGRSVYANIQKFIQFQLTVNVAALVINVVAAISSGDVPLNAVQLLWVNLIMDTLGALALATEPPTDHLMHRTPVGRREPLVTNIMWRNLMVQASYQVTVLLVLTFRGKSLLNLEHVNFERATLVQNTLIFNAFVLCQIFNEFNARKPEEFNVFNGVFRNRLFLGIVGTTFILQIIIIEFTGKFTTTTRLSWKLWLVSIGIAVISWPLAAVGKFIPVPKTPLSAVFKPLRRLFRRPSRRV